MFRFLVILTRIGVNAPTFEHGDALSPMRATGNIE